MREILQKMQRQDERGSDRRLVPSGSRDDGRWQAVTPRGRRPWARAPRIAGRWTEEINSTDESLVSRDEFSCDEREREVWKRLGVSEDEGEEEDELRRLEGKTGCPAALAHQQLKVSRNAPQHPSHRGACPESKHYRQPDHSSSYLFVTPVVLPANAANGESYGLGPWARPWRKSPAQAP